MKKILAIVLSASLVFSFSLGTAFAAEAEDVNDGAAVEQQEVEPAPAAEEITIDKVKGTHAKALSTSSIRVTWNEVEGADGYKVYKYQKSKKKYVLKKTIKSGETVTYKNTGLSSGTNYKYKVAAYANVDGDVLTGEKSEVANAKTKSVRGAKAVKIARSKVGCSYRSGSVGPKSFDCSGFVYYVYNKKGAGKVKFHRSSAQGEYNQLKKYKVGSSIKSAKKGDILFFSSSGKTHGIYHTGIYIGNGKMIHAANPRKGVCVAKTSWCPRVCAVVRISK